uniref:Uncharacterized protein n=1 Tax=Arundo donax TaxID=35708 RepID=A0A0A9EM93_ARUDO
MTSCQTPMDMSILLQPSAVDFLLHGLLINTHYVVVRCLKILRFDIMQPLKLC